LVCDNLTVPGPVDQKKWTTAAVFLAAFALLAVNAGQPGLATAYVDPISKIQAQDEAVYASTSLGMARHGDWLTPKFLGRLALYKSPFYYWLSASAVKVLGATNFALRSPSILAGAVTVAIVFAWVRAAAGAMAGLTAALLLIASHLFFVISRTGLMDALLTFETTLAMFALARDPRLESHWSFWTFGCAAGAAIMTKSTAGLFPLLALAVFCVISRERPRVLRLAQVLAVIAAIAGPWHLYQLYAHPRWFWSEYILTEQVAVGLGAAEQAVPEPQALFYAKRLFLIDPLLAIAAVIALVRVRPRAILAWMLVVIAAVLSFAYHNTTYIMPLLPAMAILAGLALPSRDAKWAAAVAALLLVAKIYTGDPVRGIPFQAESQIPSQAAIASYAALHRPNPLILVEPDDQFYSSTLELPHVRYVYTDARAERPHLPLDFEYLGIMMTAADFARFDQMRPAFATRLREWNLDDDTALATTILARNTDEIVAMINAHPEADFYVQAPFAAEDNVHAAQPGANGRLFLLARDQAK
jgi:hypothetical protein